MTLDDRFEKWDAANPDFYRLFCQFTREALASGRKRIGANSVVERIRWETMFSPTTSGFKVNDIYTSRFARKFMNENPALGEVFGTRRLRT